VHNLKVEPTPTSLESVISPVMLRANCRLIESAQSLPAAPIIRLHLLEWLEYAGGHSEHR
jgi:hypothetical protein